MDAAHILLGRLWLYDLDVNSFGKSNTYTFISNEKMIVLKPAKLRHFSDSQKTGMVTTQARKKSFHLMNENQFLKKSHEEGIIYVIVIIGESPSELVEFPPKVRQILINLSNIMPVKIPSLTSTCHLFCDRILVNQLVSL